MYMHMWLHFIGFSYVSAYSKKKKSLNVELHPCRSGWNLSATLLGLADANCSHECAIPHQPHIHSDHHEIIKSTQ